MLYYKWLFGGADDFLRTCKSCFILRVFSVFTTFYLGEMLLDKHVSFLISKLGLSLYKMYRTVRCCISEGYKINTRSYFKRLYKILLSKTFLSMKSYKSDACFSYKEFRSKCDMTVADIS